MKYLFIHQNFPAQFKHLAAELQNMGNEVVAICNHARPQFIKKTITYQLKTGNTPNINPLVIDYESKVLRAQACANILLDLKKKILNQI